MAMQSHHKIERRKSRQIRVGRIAVGGDAPVAATRASTLSLRSSVALADPPARPSRAARAAPSDSRRARVTGSLQPPPDCTIAR